MRVSSKFTRRRMLAWLAGVFTTPALAQPVSRQSSAITPFAKVVPGYRMLFPRDEGAHPAFRTEWWYITGWLNDATDPLGFQVTFFRARPDLKHDNPSAFTPRQVLIAHAALSDPAQGRLVHAQRAARSGFELADAEMGRTRVWIDDWMLQQTGATYQARIAAPELSFEFAFDATQPPLKQGQEGFSRKGRAREPARYYYSLAQIKVRGTLTRAGRPLPVAGSAWLDHEWSSQYMEEKAVGWDWIGINLHGGAALMAFRMRDPQGGAYWAGGALRRANGSIRVFSPDDIRFTPRRDWRSPRTGTTYPVSWLIKAGDLELTVEPLFDDQEHDTRATSGTIYWEGAVRALSAGALAGLGYLELTGYWRRVNL